jgi:N-carbamoylputrescine amidase
MNLVGVAATQMACGLDAAANVDNAESLVRQAAARGANVVLLQELFETPYFCKDVASDHFRLAHSADGHPTLTRMARLARELNVVLPVSFFERANNAFYNSLAVIDADGRTLGVYRKAHIPDSPGYSEKFYFSPGDSGFRVWDTAAGRIGVGICWDQWFPEAARCMALLGAEILFYPTAIGSEPQDPKLDTRDQWQRVMQGHAAANLVPVVASNRVGLERGRELSVTFYGSSFIADHTGAKVAEAERAGEAVLVHRFDRAAIAEARVAWGVFRDRRPDLYAPLLTLDGGRKP